MMKPLAKICMFFILLIVLCSCRLTMQTTTKAPLISNNAVPKLNITQPVAIKNSSLSSGDIRLCNPPGWKVMGDLYKYTNSSVDAVKDVFKRQNIVIEDKSDKILALAVNKATCSWVQMQVAITLSVSTGDGLEKEYQATRKYPNGYATTVAIERAIADCVAQMLNDKDILRYLEN